MVVQNCLRGKMHPEIVECNKTKDWEESADLGECFSCHWLLIDQQWSLYIIQEPWKTQQKVFLASAAFPLLLPLAYSSSSCLTISSRCRPHLYHRDTNPTIHGCLHCMRALAGSFPLTHRGHTLEQDFVSGQSFNCVNSILWFAHCQIWKEESRPLMKFSPLSPLEPLTLLSQKAIAFSAFQEKQQCCAKCADWQQVGIGFLC